MPTTTTKRNRTPRPARPGQRLLTLQQTSLETGIPRTTLIDLVGRGMLPFVRFGDTRRTWLRREDIDQLIARSTGTAV